MYKTRNGLEESNYKHNYAPMPKRKDENKIKERRKETTKEKEREKGIESATTEELPTKASKETAKIAQNSAGQEEKKR